MRVNKKALAITVTFFVGTMLLCGLIVLSPELAGPMLTVLIWSVLLVGCYKLVDELTKDES